MQLITNLTAHCIYSPHALLPAQDRRVILTEFVAEESVADYLRRNGLAQLLSGAPVILSINGHVVPREFWHVVYPKPNAVINIRHVVQGGQDGSNVLRIVALIVLTIVANVYGAQVGGALGFTGTTATAVGTAVITVAGTLAINAIFPVQPPDLSRLGGAEQSSPTYSLTGGSNRARPYETMPLVLGAHRMFPDVVARPYTEYEGDDQYMYMVFGFGLGNIAVQDLRIGDTPLDSYDDVYTEWSDSNGRMRMFHGNVDSASGGALTYAGGPIIRTSSIDSNALAVDIEANLFASGDNGLFEYQVRIDIEYRKVGDSTWLPFVPTSYVEAQYYWSAGYNQGGRWYQVDFDQNTLPGAHVDGDFHSNITQDEYVDGIYQYSYISAVVRWAYRSVVSGKSAGYATPSPVGSFSKSIELRNSTTKPVRKSYKRYLDVGQYEVRVTRQSGDETNPQVTSVTNFSVLRSYQPDLLNYPYQRRLGVKIRASGQLSGTIQQLSAYVSQLVYVYDGSDWQLNNSSNPAWIYLAFARGARLQNGAKIWGACLPSTRIDEPAIIAWAAFCESEGLSFDAVIDQSMSCADVLSRIAFCGRASPSWATGKLGVVWDAPQPVSQLFSMASIRRGTFKVAYTSRPLADEIIASFINPDNNWERDTVRVVAPGVTNPERSQAVELFGCTNQSAAGHLANMLMANNVYKRRSVSFETDMQALTVVRGDVITLSHDMTAWGQSGRIVAGDTLHLTLDKPVKWLPSTPAWLGVVDAAGDYTIHEIVPGSGETNVVTLVTPLSVAPGVESGTQALDWRWCFDFAASPGKRLKVDAIEPQDFPYVRIVASDDVDEYYAAKDGDFDTVATRPRLTTTPSIANVNVSEQLVRTGAGYAVKITLTWDAAGDAARTVVAYTLSNQPSFTLPPVSARRVEITLPENGDVHFDITIYDSIGRSAPGARASIDYTILGKLALPATPNNFLVGIVADKTRLQWDAVPDVDLDYYIVRSGADFSGAIVYRGSATHIDIEALSAGLHQWSIKAFDTSGNASAVAAGTEINILAPAQPSITTQVIDNNVLLYASEAQTSYPIARYEFRRGVSWESAIEVGDNGNGKFAAIFEQSSGLYTYLVRAQDVAGNYGLVGSTSARVSQPPDFVLYADQDSDFSGTRSNLILEFGELIGPVDTSQTWQAHFTSNAWSSPQDQIDDGYPLYLQPSASAASYEQIFDYGVSLPTQTITLTVTSQDFVAGVSIVPTISVSNTSSSGPWVDYVGVSQVLESSFRWVKIRLNLGRSDDHALIKITGINLKLSAKKISDSGESYANASDVGGTEVFFNKAFLDAETPRVQANSTTPVIPVVDFSDSAYPLSFKVLLFDASSGVRVSGPFGWQTGGY